MLGDDIPESRRKAGFVTIAESRNADRPQPPFLGFVKPTLRLWLVFSDYALEYDMSTCAGGWKSDTLL